MTKSGSSLRQVWGFILAPAIFVLMLILPPPAELSLAGWRAAAVGLLMATLWITEAMPIPVTALLPIVLFPVLGASSVGDATSPYANPLVFLFMGGFIIAIAMQRWNLHRRIALTIIAAVGIHPRAIIAGFMLATALISLWVSNTATALMMMPIAASVIELTTGPFDENKRDNFAVALLLGLAYAASIGGLGTLVGTPPNALLAGFMHETYGVSIGFSQWMLMGMPIVLIGLPLCFFILTFVVFPMKKNAGTGGAGFIRQELKNLGGMSAAEKRVAIIFLLTALLWIFRPALTPLAPGLSDTGIAIFSACMMFIVPSGQARGEFLLDWKAAEKLPWGILLLFGGGLALADAISATGLSGWIGNQLGALRAAPVWLLTLAVTTVVILLTELTSNTATAAAFLPIMAPLAIGVGQNPILFVVPAAIAASCAFMLPVATPPNAIIFSGGRLQITDMVKAGLLMNIAFTILITLAMFVLAPVVFHLQIGVVPAWAQ